MMVEHGHDTRGYKRKLNFSFFDKAYRFDILCRFLMQTKPHAPEDTSNNIATASSANKDINQPQDLNRAELPGHVQMSTVIGGILQGGVLLSSAVIILGLILLPFRPGGLTPQRVETFPHTFGQLWPELTAFHPQAIIVLGLLLLIATPVVRVAASVVAFWLERDRRFVIITLIVLGILIASFFLGKGGA